MVKFSISRIAAFKNPANGFVCAFIQETLALFSNHIQAKCILIQFYFSL